MLQGRSAVHLLRHPRQVFYGWWLVGIAVFTLTVVITPIFQGLGLFFVALEREFQWSRTVLSIPFTLSRAEGAVLGPLEGFLTDRVGSRRMILIGFTILGAGFIAFSYTRNIPMYYASFLVIFAGAGMGGFIPLIAAINHWFARHRAKAMAIGMLGLNLGAFGVPILAWLITVLGWRKATLALGLFIWAITVPIALLVRNRPEEYGQHPDGDPGSTSLTSPTSTLASTPEENDRSFTVPQAVRTVAFWAIVATHGFSALVGVTLAVHLIPALTDMGMSDVLAGTVVFTYGAVGASFQIAAGFLGDRFPKPPLIAAFVVAQATGVLVLTLVPTVPGAYLFAVLYGAGLGGRVPLLTALRGDYFGRRRFATIMGVSQLPMNVLIIAGPVVTGYLFDVLGSYTVPFIGLTVLNYLGATFILLARKPALPAPLGEGMPQHQG